MKIPSTHLSQTDELAEFKKEKETLNTDLTDCKARLLKLEEKQRHWEVDTKLLKESKKQLKAKLAARKKELKEKWTEGAIQSVNVAGEVDTNSLSKEISQIGLKDTDLTKMKQQIEELEEEKEKEEKRTKKIDKKCQELTQQNAKLSKQVVGNMALQGARHLIWDQKITEANKFRPYLDFI